MYGDEVEFWILGYEFTNLYLVPMCFVVKCFVFVCFNLSLHWFVTLKILWLQSLQSISTLRFSLCWLIIYLFVLLYQDWGMKTKDEDSNDSVLDTLCSAVKVLEDSRPTATSNNNNNNNSFHKLLQDSSSFNRVNLVPHSVSFVMNRHL